MNVHFEINGREIQVEVEPLKRLVDVIRYDLGLVATKIGCGEGDCGACTVLVDGEATASCLVPVVQAIGSKIVTLEGLIEKEDPSFERLRQTFARYDAAQCGSCTPGILMTCYETLRKRNPESVSVDEIRSLLAGNLCRCTGYEAITKAVVAWVEEGSDE